MASTDANTDREQVISSAKVPANHYGDYSSNGTAADRFLGLSGWAKQVTNLGLAGVVCALLAYTLYSSNRLHEEAIKAQQAELRGMREDARQAHGVMADLVTAIKEERASTRELARAVRQLADQVAAKRNKDEP